MRWVTHHKPLAVLAVIAFLGLVAVTALRVVRQYQLPGPFDSSHQGMCDFHNGIYFPARALIAGVSPYGQGYADSYPVARQIPFFSPGILLLHTPLAMLPLHVAEVIYFVFSVALVIVIAMVSAAAAGKGGRVEWVASIAALLVASRGGHITLFDGYFTFELVLATLLAIHWADEKPGRAALALVIVSAKPTYIIPLGFLLLARGNLKALILGAATSVAIALAPFMYLAYHEGVRETGQVDLGAGVAKLLNDIATTQQVHMTMPDESPVHSWTRLDLLASVCKWTRSEPSQWTHLFVMFALLFWPMVAFVMRRRQQIDDGLGGATGAMILLAVLTSLYHQSYDAMLLVVPITAAIATPPGYWAATGMHLRWGIAALMLLPQFNLLSTQSLLTKLDLGPAAYAFATGLNGLAIAFALLLVCYRERSFAKSLRGKRFGEPKSPFAPRK
ncbi:glycosyltransferase 87 family protein [Roseiconus lacunae]|uniref:glycosyltransferase 87 family protein n=1 Tax=Roseiconus lacunae TaxID=2605694 RepID=UPI0011F0A959|nr:glycosyltransferase 87 family protein [Roseiconus lacunae]